MQPSIETNLHSIFGFSSFRPGQVEAIQSLLHGQHTLAVMPTGSGKSLIFQMAALRMKDLTLVISPLIALMKDQVGSLERRGIAATYINSALPAGEQAERLERLARGEYKIVYVAPERLRSVQFLRALGKRTVSLLAVDEAHCISEWGHDFRPDYLHILQARERLGRPMTAALTATATPQVQDDIVRSLGLTHETRIVTGFNRPNLSLHVRYTQGIAGKMRLLKDLLKSYQRGAVIIYTGTRREADELSEFMSEVVKFPAAAYHAGLPAEERTRIQNEFMSGKLNAIAATNAFGMGIDRRDVRQVIHYGVPGSLEAYYQEAGRAGRDGALARATLLYDPQDRALQEFFIQQSELKTADLRSIHNSIPDGGNVWSTLEAISQQTGLHPVQIRLGLAALERAGALEHLGDEGYRMLFRKDKWSSGEIEKAAVHNKDHIRHRQIQLQEMIRYAESNSCRRKIILQHFGDTGSAEAPECCDNCVHTKGSHPASTPAEAEEPAQGTQAALIILDCIHRVRFPVGRTKIAQILHGSRAADIQRLKLNQNPYYERLRAVKQSDIEAMIGQLVDLGHIKVIGGKYPVLRLTPSGEDAIQCKPSIQLALPKSMRAAARQRAAGKAEVGVAGLNSEKQALNTSNQEETGTGHAMIDRIVALGEYGSSTAVPELITALQNKDGNVRRLAASALGKIRDPQAVDPLLDLLASEEKPQVRQYIVKALGKIGSSQARELLQQITQDNREKDYTRDAAKSALGKLKKPPSVSPRTAVSIGKAGADPIESFLGRPHPRSLSGPWQCGWSLGFHSRFAGGDWSRSGVGDLTYRLKYEGDRSVLPELVRQTLDLFNSQPEFAQVDFILPVPPSQARETDPVFCFCQALAAKARIPLKNDLMKTRQTQPQKELKTLAQKRVNVSGAFKVVSAVTNTRVLVVDDLFDSGATLDEITRLLLKNKAARVNVLTLSRTIHSDL